MGRGVTLVCRQYLDRWARLGENNGGPPLMFGLIISLFFMFLYVMITVGLLLTLLHVL